MNIASLLVPKSDTTWISASATINTAIALMERSGHSTLPVVACDGHYAGVVHEAALLRELASTSRAGPGASSQARLFDLPLDPTPRPVGVHGPAVVEAAWWEPLLPPIIVHSFLPVIDDRRVFIGIVRRRDLLAHLARHFVPQLGVPSSS